MTRSSFIVPKTWLDAVAIYAARRSSKTHVVSQSEALRHLLAVGLSAELPRFDIAWPLVKEKMKRPVRVRPDRKAQIAEELTSLFEKQDRISRAQLRREFNYRDTALVDAELVKRVRAGALALHQEHTAGRSRAVYERRGDG